MSSKEKSEKSSGGNSTKPVLEYLTKSNRPFSATDVTNYFNGQLGKSAVTNALDKLVADKKVIEKTYNKQKVYVALQDTDYKDMKNESRKLDEVLLEKKNKLRVLKEENAKYDKEISNYGSAISLADAQKQLKEIKSEISELNTKLAKFKSGNVRVVTKEEKAKATKDNEKFTKEWKKYKRIANEMLSAILENSNGIKKAALCEDLGIILDE